MADHHLRSVKVGDVTAYGMTLDASAAPQQVVYVLLKAIVDDYDAGGDRAAREQALDIQFDVCAPDRILHNVAYTDERERLENLYHVVSHWAPILGHYHDTFRTDFETLTGRMKLLTDPREPDEAIVMLNVDSPDSSKRPSASAVAHFLLTREADRWRIFWVGWVTQRRDWRSEFGESQEGNRAVEESLGKSSKGGSP